MTGKTILILGGGVGGLVAANELRLKLGREHRIVLVDKSGEHLFSPSLLWVMVGWRHPREIVKDVGRMVRLGVEVVRATVVAINPTAQKVQTSIGEINYDYLVVAMGAELAPEAMPGYTEAAYNFFSLEGVTRLASDLKAFSGGRVAVVVTRLPYKCPAAPYEAALLLHDAFRRRGLLRSVDLQVFTPEVLPMPVAGPVLGQAVRGMLEEKDIGFHPEARLEQLDASRRELRFQDGTVAGFDLLAAVPPHRPPQALKDSGLTNEAGWAVVDPRTLRTSYGNVYAIGDIVSITLPNGKPLPKAAAFAHIEAQVVAYNIAADVMGSKAVSEFDGRGYCWVEAGGGVAGFATGNFYAEPDPVIALHRPGRMWHWGKAMFEGYWMRDGLVKLASRWSLAAGSKLLKMPGSL